MERKFLKLSFGVCQQLNIRISFQLGKVDSDIRTEALSMLGPLYRVYDDKNIGYQILSWCWVTVCRPYPGHLQTKITSPICLTGTQHVVSHKKQVPSDKQWPILLWRNTNTCLPSPNQLFSQLYIGEINSWSKRFHYIYNYKYCSWI